ncbi:MAG: ABC transporter permease [Clostridia bacterium]|nr:ABC transporter permease [Clostridia bacterium]
MDKPMKRGARLATGTLKALGRQKALIAIAAMLVLMLFFDTRFYTTYNLLDMLNSAAILEILAFGVTLVIICGGVDFSIGAMMSLSGIITIKLMAFMPIWCAILASIACGAVVGAVNGFLVVHQKTEPFIITLGMCMLLKGVAQQITDAHPVSAKNLQFMKIANTKLLAGIPNLIVIMAVMFVIFHCILRFTAFGRNCYAIGGDYNVAVMSGIKARRIKWTTYIICGMMAAFCGVLLSSKLNTGSSIYGDTTALSVNCGCVVGGTSFAGSVGSVPQTFIGLMVIQLLENCMNMLGINAYTQQVCEGPIILLILWSDNFTQKRKREAV